VPHSSFGFRTLTLLAAGFLAFDGAALIALGAWSGNPMLLVTGIALVVSSGLVLLYWRSYLRRLDEIAEDRRELRDAAEELRRLLRK
jgi:membrane protein implicated in regulation of membrane protease activity